MPGGCRATGQYSIWETGRRADWTSGSALCALAVVFSLAPQSPPAGACSRHERVLRTDGELLGVLSYYGC